ncbi:MAG: aminoacyl-tRNA hydrolase [Gammaproteobacteria bacterium]
MLKLIVGLGNPGRQYEETRHNAGFLFVDYLAGLHNSAWSASSQFQGDIASLVLNGAKLCMLKPMTFMNKSGASVAKVLHYYKIKADEMLVVHDELELSEGAVKMKRDGGHAGHNGLRDIIAHIGTRDFYRLRIGIGRPLIGSVSDYVLSKPSAHVLDQFYDGFRSAVSESDVLLGGDVDVFNAKFAMK